MFDHLKIYRSQQNALPKKIFVFRDGVSEGQFAQVTYNKVKLKLFIYYMNSSPHLDNQLFILFNIFENTGIWDTFYVAQLIIFNFYVKLGRKIYIKISSKYHFLAYSSLLKFTSQYSSKLFFCFIPHYCSYKNKNFPFYIKSSLKLCIYYFSIGHEQ